MVVRLAEIADEGFLKSVWRKEVRPVLRSMTYSNLNLAPDPLHYAGYEWGLDTFISALARDLHQGRYAPERGELVRTAKGKGLSRPLCYLATRDALVYRAITLRASSQLMAGSYEWVGFTRSDKGTANKSEADDADDSFDWFRFWLARQGQILRMIDDDDVNYFVESDIANFYPSIRIEAVREHLLSKTSLEKQVVRLCIQIIESVMPHHEYSETSLMGLPQEQIGSSRDIAHSLLLDVDREFQKEGEAGRYTRFMDDILIGVSTPEEGEKCISRLQRSLESLGLYPNAAKTTVTSVEAYLHDAMVETNAEIDKIEHQLDAYLTGKDPRIFTPSAELSRAISELSHAHRAVKVRPKHWNRVTRRLYTLHRKVGIDIWQAYWRSDIDDDHSSAPSILEYVRAWPLSDGVVEQLIDLSRRYGDLYGNISLLAAETIASAPAPADESLWARIFTRCHDEFRRIAAKAPGDRENERIAAAWLIPAWKFANASQRQTILASIPSHSDATSAIRVQALPLLVSAGRPLSEWVSAKPGLAWENALAAEYLRSLQDGEKKAAGVALSLLSPELRLQPQRYVILPRAIPLIDILGHAASTMLSTAVPHMIKKLQRNPPRLRDHRVEKILSQWHP